MINAKPPSSAPPAGYRFPREVIAVAVRWYLRYGLSYRDVEELLAERGIEADHVTIYRWVSFLPAFNRTEYVGVGSRIEGIGRPRVEPSFLPNVVDRMIGVPDAASVAAMRFLDERLGLRAGPSTGTNLYGALVLACEMLSQAFEAAWSR